jgi:hypothetical protein
MLSEAELLPVIAELSIAFAGFASLISVLGAITSREQLAVNLWRLRGMLETAMLTFVFSLAPFLPAKFGASNSLSWHMTSIAFATVVAARIVFIVRFRETPQLVSRRVAWVVGGTQFFASLMLLGASFWLSLSLLVGAYHLLLLVELFASALLFSRVAMSALAGAETRS